jgi:hypothetical protein
MTFDTAVLRVSHTDDRLHVVKIDSLAEVIPRRLSLSGLNTNLTLCFDHFPFSFLIFWRGDN